MANEKKKKKTKKHYSCNFIYLFFKAMFQYFKQKKPKHQIDIKRNFRANT